MSKVTLTQAEKAADRYLAAQLELKKQKEEEQSSLKVLRQYCVENPEATIIGKCLAYPKTFAPKLKGAKAAVAAVIKKLRKVYVNLSSDVKAIQEDEEIMEQIKASRYLIKSPDIALMNESLPKDQKLADLLEANGVTIENKTEMYFKHI